jgi:two-component system, cell cycle response regulator
MQPPTISFTNTQPDDDSSSEQTSRFELALDQAPGRRTLDADETLVAPRRRASDPGLEASLILIAHPLNESLGARFRLRPRSSVVIGRAGNADVSLPEISSLSRHHSRLTYRAESVVLEDMGSTNGTYVNGQRIEQETVLHSGDRFQVGAVHFKFLQERDIENAYHQAIHDLVVLDGLTQIPNRRKFEFEGERELGRGRRYGRPLALILFDVDNFKRVNDTYGHLCGDFVLKRVVELTRPMLRREQVFARVGGEEFAILCPEAAAVNARALAERVRRKFSMNPFEQCGASFPVTCSFGIASLSPEIGTLAELYEAADRALYLSKNNGRDRVTVWEQPPPVAGE